MKTRTLIIGATAALLMGSSAQAATSIVFVGNSFTLGAGSALKNYHMSEVHDLNLPDARGQTIGGMASVFKEFTKEAGLDYDVSVEAVGGKNFDFHYDEKGKLLDRAWDHVVMQSYSQLNKDDPGNPAIVVEYAKKFDAMFHAKNPSVKYWFNATWSRADYKNKEIAPWVGKPVEQMGKDVYAGFEKAKAATPRVAGIIPVGLAWNRAFATGVADSTPADGIEAGKVDLWTWDSQHGSNPGYILASLVIFGQITGRDPLSLGDRENVAMDMGLTPAIMHSLEQVAHDELAAHGVNFQTAMK